MDPVVEMQQTKQKNRCRYPARLVVARIADAIPRIFRWEKLSRSAAERGDDLAIN